MLSEFIILFDSIFYNMTGMLFVVLGIFILVRVAGFPDLTVDGSFTIGAAVYALFMVYTQNELIALLAAVMSGCLSGAMTWTFNQKLGIGKVVAGVLAMIILLLTAPYIVGGSTKSLLNVEGLHAYINTIDFSLSQQIIPEQSYQLHTLFSIFWLSIAMITLVAMARFFKTKLGLKLRYLGSAQKPSLLNENQQTKLFLLALMVGNGLVALGGAIEAQRRGGYTTNMGVGILLVALAALVLGESIFKSQKRRKFLHLHEYLVAIFVGVFIYTIGIQVLLYLQLNFVDIKLLSALLLVCLLALSGRYLSNKSQLF